MKQNAPRNGSHLPRIGVYLPLGRLLYLELDLDQPRQITNDGMTACPRVADGIAPGWSVTGVQGPAHRYIQHHPVGNTPIGMTACYRVDVGTTQTLFANRLCHAD